jgi:hypothetical protein
MLVQVDKKDVEHAAPTIGVDARGKPKSWKNYIWVCDSSHGTMVLIGRTHLISPKRWVSPR